MLWPTAQSSGMFICVWDPLCPFPPPTFAHSCNWWVFYQYFIQCLTGQHQKNMRIRTLAELSRSRKHTLNEQLITDTLHSRSNPGEPSFCSLRLVQLPVLVKSIALHYTNIVMKNRRNSNDRQQVTGDHFVFVGELVVVVNPSLPGCSAPLPPWSTPAWKLTLHIQPVSRSEVRPQCRLPHHTGEGELLGVTCGPPGVADPRGDGAIRFLLLMFLRAAEQVRLPGDLGGGQGALSCARGHQCLIPTIQ